MAPKRGAADRGRPLMQRLRNPVRHVCRTGFRAFGGCASGAGGPVAQLPWITCVTPLMICCTAIAESIMPASRVTSTTPPSLMTRMISSE